MILDILTVLFFVLGFALLFWMIGERRRDVLHGPYVTKLRRARVEYSYRREGKVNQSGSKNGIKVGDRVRLIPQTLAWKAEMALQGQIGEVIERRDDGRITIRFDNGRLLMGRDAEAFERVLDQGQRAKRK